MTGRSSYSRLIFMKQRNNNLQYVAVALAFVIAVVGIYWQASNFYIQNNELNDFLTQGTAAVAIAPERLAELEAQAANAEQIRQERDALRARLSGTSSPASLRRSSQEAVVIARPPQSPYDTFVINVGLDEDIRLGSAVWWPPGIHLGEVVDLREDSAVVELVSANGVTHSAIVEGVPIILEGRGGDGMYADVPTSFDVSAGSPVVSDRYNLPVGIVVSVRDLTTTNQKRLYIVRPVASSVIESVYVEQ